MSETPRGKCRFCGKPLVPVGHARSNGRPHPDWDSRKYHKKCWYLLPYEWRCEAVKITPKKPADTPPRIIHDNIFNKS